MVKTSPKFSSDRLPQIYKRAFPKQSNPLERCVVFSTSSASGAICFSSKFTSPLAGMKVQERNVLVVVGDKTLYAGRASNTTLSSIIDVKIEQGSVKSSPFSPQDVAPLGLTTVALQINKRTFILVNSNGRVFLGKDIRVEHKQSKGIVDIASDFELDSSYTGSVFDDSRSLECLTQAWDIERSAGSQLIDIGYEVDPVKVNRLTEEARARIVVLGDDSRGVEFDRRERAFREGVLSQILLASSERGSDAAQDLIADQVGKTSEWSRAEFTRAAKRIRDQIGRSTGGKRLTNNEVVAAVIERANRDRTGE